MIPQNSRMLTIWLKEELISEIDDFRSTNKFPNRAEAIRDFSGMLWTGSVQAHRNQESTRAGGNRPGSDSPGRGDGFSTRTPSGVPLGAFCL